MGELFGVQVVRVTDAKVLSAAMERVNAVKLPGGVKGDGTVFAINNNAQPTLATLRYKLKDATMDAAEEAFEAGGTKFNRGTVLVKGVNKGDLDKAAGEAGVEVVALGSAPSVKTHPLRAARVAFVHTWLSTQTEGWWRLALDNIGVPYDYMSTQAIGEDRRFAREVRCDFVSAGGLQRAGIGDHQRATDVVGESAAVEEHGGNTEPRGEE